MVLAEVNPHTCALGPIPSALKDFAPSNVSSLSYIKNVPTCTQTYCCLSYFKPISQLHFCLQLLSYFSAPLYSNSHHELSACNIFPSTFGLTPISFLHRMALVKTPPTTHAWSNPGINSHTSCCLT